MSRFIDRLPWLRRAILADHLFAVALSWSVAAVVVSLTLRLMIDAGSAGVPFTTFYPAIMLAALLLGWRWGAAVTVGCSEAWGTRLRTH